MKFLVAGSDSEVEDKALKILRHCVKTIPAALLEGIYSQGRNFSNRD